MNALDVVRYGHQTLLDTLGNCSVDEVTRPGACGIWSIKDIVAHLASYELVLIGIFDELEGGGPNVMLDRYRDQGIPFNDGEVAARIDWSFDDVLAELNAAHTTVLERLPSVSPERLSLVGAIPWYGDAYALDDLIVYMYYGHKREHAAQVTAFRDALRPPR
ncbi:MAG: DinB family protein [Chloroflexia bacterium]|nr:DinB family protein [Chloroflexia bacterium]